MVLKALQNDGLFSHLEILDRRFDDLALLVLAMNQPALHVDKHEGGKVKGMCLTFKAIAMSTGNHIQRGANQVVFSGDLNC